jgi:hypothetical protein
MLSLFVVLIRLVAERRYLRFYVEVVLPVFLLCKR